MKLLLLFSIAAGAAGFSLSPQTTAKVSTTALNIASPGGRLTDNDWEGYPREKKSTPSVATRNVSPMERARMEDVMIDPNYSIAAAVFALGPLIMWYHPSYALDGSPSIIGICGGAFHMLFAALLWVQTRRVRCVFEKDAFEFYNIKGPSLDLEKGAWLEEKPANYVAGTRNRWKYDTITNYRFFPSEEFPVLCYFKETETPEWKWNRWFAAFDSFGDGQPHWFPGICNVKQFRQQMELRGVKKKPIFSYKKLNKD